MVHLQFPKDYPHSAILVELKSKTIPDKLLSKLVEVCDQEIKIHIGKQQVYTIVVFRMMIADCR